ncbi:MULTISPECIES: DUF5103 domain-containing protein [Sphingobacterium]|uniref:DUF5103 domain-containing protein n=1 Tax=Sphingobacterium litopenaei TaxID=2763500 RepID=A0ABR7YDH3_9SPHI|nr:MULTISPECIES: DUF5103 domain-containing protein [Sphingobacterium]MBD1429334.1 DUF5103 domain-containing protein [Sphingobacterium litopenaei]NGM71952.1 DUF5103 domain-containing protein [Sphingobacterium sp. SGL-16]
MIKFKSFIICLLIITTSINSYAQKRKSNPDLRTGKSNLIYDNFNYSSYIRTVQLNHIGKENEFPIIDLNKNETLTISFDDLRADQRNFYYRIEYCNADWTSSRLPSIDYLTGYEEDRIYTFQNSQNTLQAYTHYAFIFPNENIKPKLSGNYLLKVYEDADQERLLFTRKIYVLKSEVQLDSEIIPSLSPTKRSKNQKLNVSVNSSQEIRNPHTNLQIHVYQNQRQDNYKILKAPTQVSSNKITYNNPQSLDFEGNNEFRTLDLRSVRSASSSVQSIVRDSIILAQVNLDEKKSDNKYIYKPDENGKFYIRNIDFEEANLQSEYINSFFSLKDSANIKGDIYLVGAFNNYKIGSENKLSYDEQQGVWTTTQLLKQGIYNYEYITIEENKIITDKYSGSYFETENEYQILVYYRKQGIYWDELIGFKNIKTTNNNIYSGGK